MRQQAGYDTIFYTHYNCNDSIGVSFKGDASKWITVHEKNIQPVTTGKDSYVIIEYNDNPTGRNRCGTVCLFGGNYADEKYINYEQEGSPTLSVKCPKAPYEGGEVKMTVTHSAPDFDIKVDSSWVKIESKNIVDQNVTEVLVTVDSLSAEHLNDRSCSFTLTSEDVKEPVTYVMEQQGSALSVTIKKNESVWDKLSGIDERRVIELTIDNSKEFNGNDLNSSRRLANLEK